MTFSYALIADGGIILVADSQVTHSHNIHSGRVIGTYEGRHSKLRRLTGRTVFSVSGSRGFADALLLRVEREEVRPDQEYEALVDAYQSAFRKELHENYGGVAPLAHEAEFIFCGYVEDNGRKFPKITKLSSRAYFEQSPGSWAWTGAVEHGAALYLHHRFYREDPLMPLEQAKLLAYCIAAEVADQDNTVGGPIEMEVVTPDGSGPLTDLNKYEEARRELIAKVQSFLSQYR